MLSKKTFTKENKFLISLILITATAILVTGIIYKQSPLNITPLFVSLIVAYLSSKANKYALLLGGCNCLLYSVVYFILGVYASALSALIIECPLQLIGFFSWKKRPYKSSTTFRKLKLKNWVLLLFLSAIIYMVIYFLLQSKGSKFIIIDVLLNTFALVRHVLTILTYKEYSFIGIVSAPISLSLAILIFISTPAHITYVIFSIYSMICMCKLYVSVQKLYKEQQKEKTNENHTS